LSLIAHDELGERFPNGECGIIHLPGEEYSPGTGVRLLGKTLPLGVLVVSVSRLGRARGPRRILLVPPLSGWRRSLFYRIYTAVLVQGKALME